MKLFKPIVDVQGKAYCGPTSIAALTGVPVSRIRKMIRRVRGPYARDVNGRKIAVRGTENSEVLKVLERLGCKVERMKETESTIARFAADTAHIGAAFLVNVTNHYIAVSAGMICDTYTQKEIVPASKYSKPRWRVQRAWRIEAPVTPRYTIDDPLTAPAREPKPKRDLKAVRADRLAKQIEAWEAKERRARNALKRLRPKLARYKKLGIAA